MNGLVEGGFADPYRWVHEDSYWVGG